MATTLTTNKMATHKQVVEDDPQTYLTDHKIPQLLEHLASWVMYHTPDDPKSFLIQHLKSLKENSDGLPLLDETNLMALFKMLDIQSRGYITLEQYKHAMMNIGLSDYNTEPIGGHKDKISCDTFIHESKRAMKKYHHGFLEPI